MYYHRPSSTGIDISIDGMTKDHLLGIQEVVHYLKNLLILKLT